MVREASRKGHAIATAAAVLLLATIAVIQARSDGLLIEVYGVDTLFVLDVILRTAEGQVPHDDFTLHLGALPFAMISGMSETVVTGLMRAQWALGALLIGVGAWVGATRLGPWATFLLLASVVLVATALSTTFDPRITLALFYNRWAWAIALVFIVAVMLERDTRTNSFADSVLIGLLAMALLTTKVTFFAVLVPLGALAFALRGRWPDIMIVAGTCIAVALVVAIVVSPTFWISYAENLLWVASNPLRQTPGQTMTGILQTGQFAAGHMAFAFVVVLVLLSRGITLAGLYALFGIGFLFIQNQNFGFAPLWALAMAVVALAWTAKETGLPYRLRFGFGATAVAFIATSALTLLPVASSTFRNAGNGIAGETPIMPGVAALTDIAVTPPQWAPIVELDRPLSPDAPPHMTTCHVTGGFLQVFRAISETLADVEGPLFVADAPSPFWMQNGTKALPAAAPWNYGSLRGLEAAAHVIIPACPSKPSYQKVILARMAEEGITLTPVQETRWVTVMRWSQAP